MKCIVAGLAVAVLGTLPWALLIKANLLYLPTFPWATPVMAVILLGFWLYFAKGLGWPRATAEARRQCARANPVPDDLWGPALGAGMLGLFSTLLLQGVLARLVTLPQQRELDPSQYPVLTVFVWVTMSAVVAGVVEETAFRGYLQRGIERRYGLLPAILVTGSLFGLIHFTHPEVGLVLLPFYLAVAAVYGLMSAATNSTYPSMVLHAGGNMFSAFTLFTQGRSEWQLTVETPQTIWQSGVDASFVMTLILLFAVGTATVFAFRGLFRAGRSKVDRP
jgi:membrane protease YdiL (CAAX protease family)